MEPVATKLPAALGSTAALVVACIGLLVQTSPTTCLLRATAAFAVFSAFGIVIRYLLADDAGRARPAAGDAHNEPRVEDIAPGTSIEDLLAEEG